MVAHMYKIVIKFLQGNACNTNHVRWASYILYCCISCSLCLSKMMKIGWE